MLARDPHMCYKYSKVYRSKHNSSRGTLRSPVDPQEVLEHIEMPAAVYEQLPALCVPGITSSSPIDALPAAKKILVVAGQGGGIIGIGGRPRRMNH